MERKKGNRTIIRGNDYGGNRYKYDFEICLPELGWKQYDTDQDASYFGVWVNVGKLEVFTYAEGDTTRVICDNAEALRDELKEMAEFFGDPPPAFTCYSQDGTVTRVYDERSTI